MLQRLLSWGQQTPLAAFANNAAARNASRRRAESLNNNAEKRRVNNLHREILRNHPNLVQQAQAELNAQEQNGLTPIPPTPQPVPAASNRALAAARVPLPRNQNNVVAAQRKAARDEPSIWNMNQDRSLFQLGPERVAKSPVLSPPVQPTVQPVSFVQSASRRNRRRHNTTPGLARAQLRKQEKLRAEIQRREAARKALLANNGLGNNPFNGINSSLLEQTQLRNTRRLENNAKRAIRAKKNSDAFVSPVGLYGNDAFVENIGSSQNKMSAPVEETNEQMAARVKAEMAARFATNNAAAAARPAGTPYNPVSTPVPPPVEVSNAEAAARAGAAIKAAVEVGNLANARRRAAAEQQAANNAAEAEFVAAQESAQRAAAARAQEAERRTRGDAYMNKVAAKRYSPQEKANAYEDAQYLGATEEERNKQLELQRKVNRVEAARVARKEAARAAASAAKLRAEQEERALARARGLAPEIPAIVQNPFGGPNPFGSAPKTNNAAAEAAAAAAAAAVHAANVAALQYNAGSTNLKLPLNQQLARLNTRKNLASSTNFKYELGATNPSLGCTPCEAEILSKLDTLLDRSKPSNVLGALKGTGAWVITQVAAALSDAEAALKLAQEKGSKVAKSVAKKALEYAEKKLEQLQKATTLSDETKLKIKMALIKIRDALGMLAKTTGLIIGGTALVAVILAVGSAAAIIGGLSLAGSKAFNYLKTVAVPAATASWSSAKTKILAGLGLAVTWMNSTRKAVGRSLYNFGTGVGSRISRGTQGARNYLSGRTKQRQSILRFIKRTYYNRGVKSIEPSALERWTRELVATGMSADDAKTAIINVLGGLNMSPNGKVTAANTGPVAQSLGIAGAPELLASPANNPALKARLMAANPFQNNPAGLNGLAEARRLALARATGGKRSRKNRKNRKGSRKH